MKATTTKRTGRSCKCGYIFSLPTTIRSRKFESFAVVSDKSYQRFLKAEVGVLRAADGIAKSRATVHSSKFVGSLLECPDCGRFLLTTPGGNSEAFYLREDKI
jgi:hypothetical protein